MPRKIIFAFAAMLAIAALPFPVYGLYQLVRLLAFIGFAVLCYTQYQRDPKSWLPWILGVFAFVFNPIFPIYLGKALWAVTDLVAAVFLLLNIKRLEN